MEPIAREDASHAGLLHSLRIMLATLLATVRTRGELLQVELEEEELRLAGIAVFAAAAAFFLVLAVVMLTFFVILIFWDTHRVLATGLIALSYVLIGVSCALITRKRARVKSKLFAASLAELRKDGERLSQR
jgi:uncharacterized membrane protein YqjE